MPVCFHTVFFALTSDTFGEDKLCSLRPIVCNFSAPTQSIEAINFPGKYFFISLLYNINCNHSCKASYQLLILSCFSVTIDFHSSNCSEKVKLGCRQYSTGCSVHVHSFRSPGNGMKWPFHSYHQRKKAQFPFSKQSRFTTEVFTMMFTRGIGLKRLIIYGVPFLILIMVFQIWKRPCYSAPFGGQV